MPFENPKFEQPPRPEEKEEEKPEKQPSGKKEDEQWRPRGRDWYKETDWYKQAPEEEKQAIEESVEEAQRRENALSRWLEKIAKAYDLPAEELRRVAFMKHYGVDMSPTDKEGKKITEKIEEDVTLREMLELQYTKYLQIKAGLRLDIQGDKDKRELWEELEDI